jgi:hypothetical protein
MDSSSAQKQVELAVQRTKQLRSASRLRRPVYRPRKKKSIFSPYETRGVHVKRVMLDHSDETAARVREAFAKSREDLYARLVAQFGGDDCGCN